METKEQSLRQEYQELESRLSDPSIFSSKDYPKLAKRKDAVEKS